MQDKLTGLYSRKFFMEQLDLEVKRCQRYKRPMSVLCLELEYGYFHPGVDVRWSMGYTLFKQLGPLVLSTLRNVDLAARYEGEVFACFLPETGFEGANIAAERLRSRVEKHWFLGQPPGGAGQEGPEDRFRVALNVGVAIFPEHGRNPLELVESAREAVNQARKEGGNKVIIGKPVSLPIEPQAHPDAIVRPESDAPASWDALAAEQSKGA